MKRANTLWMLLVLVGSHSLWAATPYIHLGPADELALDQPRVAIELFEPDTGRSIGPDIASTFLLDTGANGILAVDDSIYEMNQQGYVSEGTFFEQGVGGFTEFDVSAKYHIDFAGSDGQRERIENSRILSSTETSFCPIAAVCSFFGIMGMPAMDGRVTTMDMSTLAPEEEFTIDDIFNGNVDAGFLSTTFSDEMPETSNRRYHVPLTPAYFPAEGDGPIPSWSDIPFVRVSAHHLGEKVTGNYILDTGAQLSLMSTQQAFALGLDENGNGTLNDEAIAFQDIGGVGGTVSAPVMLFEELRVPTEEGADLVFDNMQVAVIDIDPTIDGIFGMNLMTSGWTGRLFGNEDLEALKDLLGDAGFADLLEQLGGLGDDGASSPYGFFEQVHFDFRNWASGKGAMVLDLNAEVTGITAHDGTHGDLDGDNDVDLDDRTLWIHDEKNSFFGDSNLDGLFNSNDLVQVFQLGEYEDNVSMNSTWASGDWNMDGEFNTKDLVLAFQDGGYTQAVASTASVPEPTGQLLCLLGGLVLAARRAKR